MSVKEGLQQQKQISWTEYFLNPVSDWLVARFFAYNRGNRKKTRKYLSEVDPSSCLKLLNKALNQHLGETKDVSSNFKFHAQTDRNGRHVWKLEDFARFLQTRGLAENATVAASIPVLWCAFSTAAYFPFSLQSFDLAIDIDGFKRALAFLAMRGYGLFGTRSDGSFLDPRGGGDTVDNRKTRLARVMFRSLSIPWSQSHMRSPASHAALQLRDIRDAIYFTQPITNDQMTFIVPQVTDEEWEAASYRVLLVDHGQFKSIERPVLVNKADLEKMFQLILLQAIEDRAWTASLDSHSSQHCGEVMYSHFSSDTYQVLRATEVASALMVHEFPGREDYVTWEQFKTCCEERPYFLFALFQLWATLFTSNPHGQAVQAEKMTTLPISVANALSYLNVAHMASGFGLNNRYHTNELGMQLDFRAAPLMASTTSTPELKPEELHRLSAQPHTFYIVLIRGEQFDLEGKSVTRVIVALLSPPEEEMWRPIPEKSFVQYTWQTSVIQLEPCIAMAGRRGLSASIEGGELILRSHAASEQKGVDIRIHLAGQVVKLEGLATIALADLGIGSAVSSHEADSASTMRLTGLEYYRMPGSSSKIISSGGRKRFWQE
ncbi:hypothetical protein ACEQ8H_003454 [Pleosporales sp. CAS-2024a]